MSSEAALVIRKVGPSKYKVVSKTTGRPLGTYRSKKAAAKREKQVVFFKNLAHSSGGRGSLAAKVRKKSLVSRAKGK